MSHDIMWPRLNALNVTLHPRDLFSGPEPDGSPSQVGPAKPLDLSYTNVSTEIPPTVAAARSKILLELLEQMCLWLKRTHGGRQIHNVLCTEQLILITYLHKKQMRKVWPCFQFTSVCRRRMSLLNLIPELPAISSTSDVTALIKFPLVRAADLRACRIWQKKEAKLPDGRVSLLSVYRSSMTCEEQSCNTCGVKY